MSTVKFDATNAASVKEAFLLALANSTAGMTAMSNVKEGEILTLVAIETSRTGRSDISPTNPIFHFKTNTGKQHQVSSLGLPALRVIEAANEASVMPEAAKCKFSHELASVANLSFLKTVVEAADGNIDLGGMKLRCVSKKIQSTEPGGSVPAMNIGFYNGSAKYTDGLRNPDADRTSLRAELYASGVRSSYAAYTPETHPEAYVYTPVFVVSF